MYPLLSSGFPRLGSYIDVTAGCFYTCGPEGGGAPSLDDHQCQKS